MDHCGLLTRRLLNADLPMCCLPHTHRPLDYKDLQAFLFFFPYMEVTWSVGGFPKQQAVPLMPCLAHIDTDYLLAMTMLAFR
jgi:hypothetical protein